MDEMRTYDVVLVCGGRDYADEDRVREVLDEVCPLLVVEGGALGADRLARDWAANTGVHFATVPALWGSYARSAGYLRNAAMLHLKPDLVVAFPGGRGTADMVRQARKAGVEVLEIRE